MTSEWSAWCYWLCAVFDAMESWTVVAGMFSFLDLFSSTMAMLEYRARVSEAKPWLESLVCCTMLQFGGTTMTGVLLGQTPSWLASAKAFPSLLLVWCLVLYAPGDFYYRALQWRVLALPVSVLGLCSAAHSGTSWGMDKVVRQSLGTGSCALSSGSSSCSSGSKAWL